MDTSASTAGPTLNSPSDLSYSSGASHASTRTTSPATSSQPSSPRLDLQHHLAATDIETPSTNTLLDPQDAKMDRNSFQSVNDRRAKLNTMSTSTNSPFQQHQQQQQPQPLRVGMGTGAGGLGIMATTSPASRSLASTNWRSSSESVYGGGPFDTPTLQAGRNTTYYPANNNSSSGNGSGGSNTNTTLVQRQMAANMAPYPSHLGSVAEMQLDASYAYCYDRGNGQYTRLIPADMLPALHDIPALQQGCSGMMVLPQPRALPPNGRSSNTEPVAFRTPPPTPSTPADNIQSRIDTIVASTPPTPTHTHHGASISTTTPPASGLPTLMTHLVNAGGGMMAHHHQQPHHGHHHQPSLASSQQPQRRPKIYCDKWVHEGVCAFTQQGCKYKHEMPFDKVTQHQLGLFHGLPAWWKKHQAELARQRDVVVVSEGDGGRGSGVVAQDAKSGLTGSGPDRDPFSRGDSGGSLGPNNLTGTGASTMAWRRAVDQGLGAGATSGSGAEQNRGGMSRALAGVGGQAVASRNSMMSVSSPWGPIAPPPRSKIRVPGVSPSRSVPTNNPYASLEALDESGNDE